jgi:hypothetical protein
LRVTEYKVVSTTSKDGIIFKAAYSVQQQVKLESTINILRTLFICVVLSVASHYFTKDAQELVLDPLERMIEKVKIISQNPMSAATDEVNYAGVFSFANTEDEKKIMRKSKAFKGKTKE